ncbi:hypothetical protein RND71_039330 [Anisodus tanguticus]|uniref:Cytochrome b5 heme-binding domain-containing protein n=1 Tax=Anisodus tanguticus TaxID=243964 RepID=A0AAE1QVP3_9SOLA|nr:hypothetical protein RND71_039330 [Anisodus tanguticus]
MALQLLDTLKDSITAYTGLSPTTFFTVVALALALYYLVSGFFGSSDHGGHHQRSRNFEEQVEPVQLGEITEEELKGYDGTDPKKPLLMAIKGQIYDVSQSRMFYGPGGPYALFAGEDASRALAKMSFEEKDLTGDISGLDEFELDALQDWEYKFMSKYVKVGSVKQAVPVNYGEANVESVEATDGEAKPAEGGASGSAKPLEDDGPSKISEAAKVAPSESVADYLFGTEGVAAEKRNAWNGQFWSFKVLLKFNLPSKIASKISKLALFAATLPRKTYTFTVGYHELTGTKVPLKKPMLVLKKIKLDIEEEKGDINLSRVELDVIGGNGTRLGGEDTEYGQLICGKGSDQVMGQINGDDLLIKR